MTDKPKIDLSQPGGRPRAWHEQDTSDSVWLGDLGMFAKLGIAVLLLVGGACLFLVQLLKHAG